MRTHRNRRSLSEHVGTAGSGPLSAAAELAELPVSRPAGGRARKLALGLGLVAGLLPLAAGAQPADGKVKYLYKPVPCAPCPCECPDTRADNKMMAPRSAVGAELPARVDSEPEARPAPTAVPRAPQGEPREAAPTAAKQTPSAVGGTVTVRDRGGKDKADRSGVIVYIEQLPNKKFAALKKVRQMAQRDKAFVPGVVAITRGSTVDFPNEDKFFHNVFSLSEGNAFDLQLYRAGESKSVTFEKTGVVDVYCNIHPNMWGQILVLDNPFFTTTGKDGGFEIAKLPPGSYTVVAWISGGDAVRQQVKVETGRRAEVSFVVREGVSNKAHLNKFNQSYGRYTQ